MNEKMFRDYIVLEGRLKESSLTIGELRYDNRQLADENRNLRDLLDEKNKDIASLDRQLREMSETLERLKGWSAYIPQPIKSEGYDGKEKVKENNQFDCFDE